MGISLDIWMGGGSNYTGGSQSDGVWRARSAHNTSVLEGNGTLFGTNTSHDFYITGVQVEQNDTATEFEHRSFGEELQACKRYYEKSFAYGTAPANGSSTTGFAADPYVNTGVLLWSGPNSVTLRMEVEKRVQPTVIRYGNSQGYWGYINAGSSPSGSDNTHIFHANIFVQTFSSKELLIVNQASGNPLWSIKGHWTAESEH
jgi:hypothetical protein